MRLARPHAAAWPHRFTLACRFLNPNPSQSPTQRRGLSCPRAQRAFLFCFCFVWFLARVLSGGSALVRAAADQAARNLSFFFLLFLSCDRTSSAYMVPCIRSFSSLRWSHAIPTRTRDCRPGPRPARSCHASDLVCMRRASEGARALAGFGKMRALACTARPGRS